MCAARHVKGEETIQTMHTGNAEAMYNLGCPMREDSHCDATDTIKARELYERAVNTDNADAMNNLGDFLQGDDTCEPMYAFEAKYLYERAVDAGDAAHSNKFRLP